MTDLPDFEIIVQPDDYGCLICQQYAVVFPTAYCERCGAENQHMGRSPMTDFNDPLTKLNAVLNPDGKAEMEALKALAERKCSIKSHDWELAIEEAHVSLTTPPCGSDCWFPDGTLGDEFEWLTMDPIPVKVDMTTACPAYETDDDGVVVGPSKPMGGYESGGHWIAHGSHCDCDW